MFTYKDFHIYTGSHWYSRNPTFKQNWIYQAFQAQKGGLEKKAKTKISHYTSRLGHWYYFQVS